MTVALEKLSAPAPVSLTPEPHLPTWKEVGCQAYRDWFGKDVQETPTVSYIWAADQFGHVGLGFQGTFLIAGLVPLFLKLLAYLFPGPALLFLNYLAYLFPRLAL